MSLRLRRLAGLALAAAVLGSVVPGPTPVAAADISVGQAESELVARLNAERTSRGLVPLRVDPRLMAIARARSTDMAKKGYFSHTQPDGRKVFDLLRAAGVTYYSAGEIIAYNTYPSLSDSVARATTGWMNSSGHRSIILSSSSNYVGVGLAIANDGKRYWTGVFIKGPDRTGAWTKLAGVETVGTTSTYKSVKVSWTGGDVRLQVLTSGFKKFAVQRRPSGGTWAWVTTSTTSKSYTLKAYRGKSYEVRVKACDQAGNCGAWQAVTIKG